MNLGDIGWLVCLPFTVTARVEHRFQFELVEQVPRILVIYNYRSHPYLSIDRPLWPSQEQHAEPVDGEPDEDQEHHGGEAEQAQLPRIAPAGQEPRTVAVETATTAIN
jgi:hypothetical protein